MRAARKRFENVWFVPTMWTYIHNLEMDNFLNVAPILFIKSFIKYVLNTSKY